MSARRLLLDVIEVRQPCPADWGQMKGDAKRRFCEHCHKFVHNLSEMPTNEAERLVCESAGELCVRFARDPMTNRILTLDYRPRPVPSRRRAFLTIASIVGAVIFSSTWIVCRIIGKPVPPPPAPTPPMSGIMGAMVAPLPPMSQTRSTPQK